MSLLSDIYRRTCQSSLLSPLFRG